MFCLCHPERARDGAVWKVGLMRDTTCQVMKTAIQSNRLEVRSVLRRAGINVGLFVMRRGGCHAKYLRR